jgi:hypothetical protein
MRMGDEDLHRLNTGKSNPDSEMGIGNPTGWNDSLHCENDFRASTQPAGGVVVAAIA